MTQRPIILKGTKRELMPIITQLMGMQQLLADRDVGNIYGMPVDRWHESRIVTHRPQVTLIFIEQDSEVEATYSPISAELSFRLMGENETTMNPAKALILATKINTLFGGATPFTWKKGRELWGYIDPARGYHLAIYAWNETEAKKVISKILDIQNHVTNYSDHLKDWAKRDSLTKTPIIPPTDTIYGKARRRPRKLPIGNVRFRRAELTLEGLNNPVLLVDLTGSKQKALVRG